MKRYGCPAIKHEYGKDLTMCAAYTAIWNVLNVPSGVVPITLV